MTQAKYAQLKKFFGQFPTQKFSKNSIVFKPGDKIENIYFLKSGFIRAYTKTAFGENTLNFFKPIFPASVIHCFTSIRNDLFFQTLTTTETYVIPQVDFKKMLAKDPEMMEVIMEFFFSSILRFITNQGTIINGNAMNKVSAVLLQLVYDYGDTGKGTLTVNFPATHRILANVVGLTRETTSVQMSKLQKLGIISTQRTRFQVKNLEKLKSLAAIGE